MLIIPSGALAADWYKQVLGAIEFATLWGAGKVWRHADLSALPRVHRHS
jgi:hypothetical protein